MFDPGQTRQIRSFLIHRNPFLASAVQAAIPQATQLVAALDRAAAAQTASSRAAAEADAQVDRLIEGLVSAIRAGDDAPVIDDDLVAIASERQQASLLVEMHTRVSVAIAAEATDGLNDASRADVMLKHLNGRLQRLVSEARALPLAGASTAEEAIEQGVGAAWKAYQQLRTDSFLIRQAQGEIMSKLHEQHQQYRHTFGYFENYPDLDPGWWSQERRTEMRREDESGHSPWPHDLPEKFLWTVQHAEARPWVPTLPQLQQTVSTSLAAAQQLREAEAPNVDMTVRSLERGAREQTLTQAYTGT